MIAAEDIFLQIIEYANKLGVLAILIIILYAGMRRWWVFGWNYKECKDHCDKIEAEKDAWRETALKASNVASDAFAELRRRS